MWSQVRTRHVFRAVDELREYVHGRATDLLLRSPPRVGQPQGTDLMQPGETPLDAAVRLAGSMPGTVLPIQGPPGAGKTYTAARMIVKALELGLRVGITVTRHR
jgi:hypothetical protein